MDFVDKNRQTIVVVVGVGDRAAIRDCLLVVVRTLALLNLLEQEGITKSLQDSEVYKNIELLQEVKKIVMLRVVISFDNKVKIYVLRILKVRAMAFVMVMEHIQEALAMKSYTMEVANKNLGLAFD